MQIKLQTTHYFTKF